MTSALYAVRMSLSLAGSKPRPAASPCTIDDSDGSATFGVLAHEASARASAIAAPDIVFLISVVAATPSLPRFDSAASKRGGFLFSRPFPGIPKRAHVSATEV